MRKIVLFLMALVGALNVQAAENYSYLTFEMADGETISVAASSMKMTVNGNTLTVGSQVFNLSNLKRMYFSTTDETSTTGIETTDYSQAVVDETAEIFDLSGHKVSKEQMRKGVYIVKTKNRSYKTTVK